MSSLDETRDRALLNERLQNLDAQLRIAQQRWDNLTVRGPGWAGDSEQGFIFNPRQRGVAPTIAAATCANTAISISFSGIQFDCGCVAPTNDTPSETESINIIDASALNSTFTLANTFTVGASCIFDLTIPVIISANWDRFTLGCVPDTALAQADITVLLNNGDIPLYPSGFNIYISLGGEFGFGSDIWVFFALVSPSGSLIDVPNTLSCNTFLIDPASPHLNSGGHGGTCTITGL